MDKVKTVKLNRVEISHIFNLLANTRNLTQQLSVNHYQLRNLLFSFARREKAKSAKVFEKRSTIFAWARVREFRYNAKVAEDVGRLEAGEQR